MAGRKIMLACARDCPQDPYKEAEEAWKKTPEGTQTEKEITRWRQLEEEQWQKSRQGTKK